VLPRENGDRWQPLVDTRSADPPPDTPLAEPTYKVMGRSLVVLKRVVT